MLIGQSQPTTNDNAQNKEQATHPWKKRKFIYAAVIFAIALALLTSYYFSNKRREKLESDIKSDEKAKKIAKSMIERDEEPAAPPAASEEELLDLAKRLKKHGIKVYGVTPCGWTKRQRDMFGARDSPARKVMESLYTECRSPDVCPGVMGYPTWKHGEHSFPGFKNVSDLEEIISEVKNKKRATAPRVHKKRVEVMEVVEEVSDEEEEDVVVQQEPTITIEEIQDDEEDNTNESDQVVEDTPPAEPTPVATPVVKKKVRTVRKKTRVEKARGVSEFAPLAVPDMPGTSVFEPSVSRAQEQSQQGNIPHQSLEQPDPVIDIVNQFTQSYEQVASDEKRNPDTAAVNEAKLPQSATISTGDALEDKRLPIKKRKK